MTNKTLRRKIASVVSHRVTQCQNTSIIADAILATIKADDDAKDKQIEEQVAWVQDLATELNAAESRIAELEAKLAKAVRLMELSVELATWNTTLLDDVILFITELKGTDQ